MSFPESHKEKLAEALLGVPSQMLNYEVLPPAPSSSSAAAKPLKTSAYSYVSESGYERPWIRQAGAISVSGYSVLGGLPQPAGYVPVPVGVPQFSSFVPSGNYYSSGSIAPPKFLDASGASIGEDDEKSKAMRLAQRLANDLHLNRDFNKDYQTLMEAVDANPDDLEVLTSLRLLTKEFLDTAQSVGQIIIDELFEDLKTIPPVHIGGIAGGVKYVYRNILYKICLDTKLDNIRGWMHGGDRPSHEKAMKTGAHELRGLMHYSSLRVSGLHFPLMLVMDYKGFRLVAESLLPINKETIKYGSSDGGETVHASGDDLLLMMKTVGQQLHLAPHLVKNKTIFGPGDQEVHLGLDGRYYCIDLARVFPCEPARHHLNPSATPSSHSSATSPIPMGFGSIDPSIRQQHSATPPANGTRTSPLRSPVSEEPRSIFYKFFRPEFILSYKTPLACDCFTAWGKHDSRFQQHNKEVIGAFGYLRSLIIPKFASIFDRQVMALPRDSDPTTFWRQSKPIELLHSMGINIRHLGIARSQCVNEFARTLLMNEMIARVVKNLIRKKLREEMLFQSRLSHEQVKDIVIQFYNFILGKGPPPDITPSPQQGRARPGQQNRHAAESSNADSSTPVFILDRSMDSTSSNSSTESPSPLSLSSISGSSSIPLSPTDRLSSSFNSSTSSTGISHSSHLNATEERSHHDTFPNSDFFQQFYFQFEQALFGEELKYPSKAILAQMDRKLLFWRLNEMLGIEMNEDAKIELQSTTSYEFVHCDISSIAPRVRFMNLVDEAEGLALWATAKRKRTDQRKRLLRLATNKFQASCVSLPHNFNGYFFWGRSLYAEGKIEPNRADRIKILESALERLETVTTLRTGHAKAWMLQVKIWLALFETQEYQERICDDRASDPLLPDFSFLADHLRDSCTKLMRLDITWADKLLRKARVVFSLSQSPNTKGEPSALLRVVEMLCLAIQAVCGPMLEALPSVPLPPDAIMIKLPRIHVESLLLCARSLQLRSILATERANAPKRVASMPPVSSQPAGINHDELHSKRLKFQIAEQFTAALETKFIDDAAYFDRLLIESLPEIVPLIKSSKNLAQAFQERCRQITKLSFPTSSSRSRSSSDLLATISSSPSQRSSLPQALSSSSLASSGSVAADPLSLFIDLGLVHVGPRLISIDVSGVKTLAVSVLTQLLERACKTLTALNLSDTAVTNQWLLTSLMNATALQHLELRDLKISDETAVALCKQHGATLKTLNLAGNSLTSFGLYKMSRELKCLESIDLSGNRNIGANPHTGSISKPSDFMDAMSNLRPSLTNLSLLECYSVTNQAIFDIASKLRNLRHLALSSKQISDQYLMKLESLVPDLCSLSLRGLSNSDGPFKHLLSLCGPNCTSLSLRACMGITDDAAQALKDCHNLHSLDLGLCTQVKGLCLVTLSKTISTLTQIDLSGLSIDPALIAHFVAAQPGLTSLNLSSMETAVHDAAIISMLQHIPKLQDINLSGNHAMTYKSLEAMAKFTPRLETLALADCHSLRNIEPYILRLKLLTSLNIRFAHPPKFHCLLNPKFAHIKNLVLCSCRPLSAALGTDAHR